MGYTHYWTQKKTIKSADWIEIQAACIRIIAAAVQSGVRIAGADGTGSPLLNTETISFNGDGKEDCSYSYTSSFDGTLRRVEQFGAHESFWLDRKLQRDENERSPNNGKLIKWTFCKTARKPYDVAVTAIGCCLESIWPNYFEFTSDGHLNDWQAGLALARQALPSKGNQLDAPAWVRDETRWVERGISGSKLGLHKHITQGWVIVDQSKPLLEPSSFVPEDGALRAVNGFKNRCYGGKEYARLSNKLINSLARIYSPAAQFIKNQTAESVMLGSMLQQFSQIANKQLSAATA